jgi:hypothetical protein
MNDPTAPYWTVEELLARLRDHDYSLQEWEILTIVSELAKDGRVRAIGRPCDDAGHPGDQWELTPAHQWADLVVHLRPRAQPHPGDVFWRSSGRRAWAFVQFCEEDLEREWLAEIFARPRHEALADIIVPPIKRTAAPSPHGHAAAPAPQDIGGTTSGAKPVKPSRDQLQTRYNARVTPEHAPTVAEDRAWAKNEGISQIQAADLRRNSPDRRLHERHRRRR